MRPSGPGHALLRHRNGALHGFQHPRGAALPVGGPALALGRRGGKVAGKSGLSQARSRLGELPLRRLYEQVVQPVATRATKRM